MDIIAFLITSNSTGHLSSVEAHIKETIKAPRHWPLQGNPSVTGGFPSQRVSNAENVSIWWRHHDSGPSTNNLPLIFGACQQGLIGRLLDNPQCKEQCVMIIDFFRFWKYVIYLSFLKSYSLCHQPSMSLLASLMAPASCDFVFLTK